MHVMNWAQVSGSQFETQNSEKQQKLSLTFDDRWQMAAGKSSKTSQREERKGGLESSGSYCVLHERRVRPHTDCTESATGSQPLLPLFLILCSWEPSAAECPRTYSFTHRCCLNTCCGGSRIQWQHSTKYSHKYSFEVLCWQWVTYWQ